MRLRERVKSLHLNGLVHLDIKPPNILYCKERGTFYLADFGLTRAVLSGPGYKHDHKSNACTLRYSCEEFVEHRKSQKTNSLDLHYQDKTALTITEEEIERRMKKKTKQKPLQTLPPAN